MSTPTGSTALALEREALQRRVHELEAQLRSLQIPRHTAVCYDHGVLYYHFAEEGCIRCLQAQHDAQIATLQQAHQQIVTAFDALVRRIGQGHTQSIGSFDNVRMVQFGVEEIARYRALLPTPPEAPV